MARQRWECHDSCASVDHATANTTESPCWHTTTSQEHIDYALALPPQLLTPNPRRYIQDHHATSKTSLSFLPAATPSQPLPNTAVPQYPSLAPPTKTRIKPVRTRPQASLSLLCHHTNHVTKVISCVINPLLVQPSHQCIIASSLATSPKLANPDKATDNQLTTKSFSYSSTFEERSPDVKVRHVIVVHQT